MHQGILNLQAKRVERERLLYACPECAILERLNAMQAGEIEFLKVRLIRSDALTEDLIRNKELRVQTTVKIADMEPIGGFKSLRNQIAEAERAANKEYEERVNAGKE